MPAILALVAGALIGFVGSRKLRRPQHAAAAASVARTVGASVGRRKGLSAPELQRACFSEMVRHVRVDAAGRSQAPARYQLVLHPDDLAVVDETRAWFTDGLVDALRDAARQNDWTLEGTVDIRYEADPRRRAGAPIALAVEPKAGPEARRSPVRPGRAAQAVPTAAALALRRSDTGETTPLGTAALQVGRGSEVDILIDDKRVSRGHAVITPARSGWTVTDLGSSNGTTLNSRLLAPQTARPINVGDVIGVGPVELVVEAASQPAGGGTRALDDRDRTRISGEVLPRGDERRP